MHQEKLMNIKNQLEKIKIRGTTAGFTMVELLVAMVIVSISMGAIYAVSVTVTESYSNQRELAQMQQNMRAAMYIIKNDLRNSGRNPTMDGRVGITSVGRFNPDADAPAGYPGITMTSWMDTDGDGEAESTSLRTISYQVMDLDGDGRRELRRQDSQNGVAWTLVFDGIEDIGFAYAFDSDNDLDLDRAVGAGGVSTVMWAVDTDNLIGLDTNLDAVPDGDITVTDDTDADGDIDAADGGLGAQIALSDIRAVRIWLLARSRRLYRKFTDNSIYTVGDRVIDMSLPANANRNNFRHKLLVGAVALHNHERKP
jgi:type IV pilus assembly protein PilW